VRHLVTEALRREADTYALRFACDDCCHRDEDTGAFVCSLGFPPEPRRAALADESIAFCKSFELG
jgi:hypothetical protein